MKQVNFTGQFLTTLFFIFIFIPVGAQEGTAMVKQWGQFGDKPGQFKYPTMITADNQLNIFVVDQHNHRVQKFDQNGTFITMWGKYGSGSGEFNYPYGIALDSKGNVYVSDMNNNRIQKFDANGVFISSVVSYGSADGQFKYPYGITIDENDVLYVIDAFNYRIQKFDTDLKFIEKWGTQESIGFKLYMPHEIAVLMDGNVVLSDRQNHRISVFSKEGKLIKRFGIFGEGKNAEGGQFSEPHGVAVNGIGEIFICDRYNFRIQKFNPSGEFVSLWSSPGLFDDSKHFPLGITITRDGDTYVTDHLAHCIQKFSIPR